MILIRQKMFLVLIVMEIIFISLVFQIGLLQKKEKISGKVLEDLILNLKTEINLSYLWMGFKMRISSTG